MKFKIISLALILVFLASLISVYPEDSITTDAINSEIEELAEKDIDNINPGVTPDKFGYGLKIRLEKLRLGLTFNKQKRVELELELAKKRLAEAKLMADLNKTDALAKAKEEHKKLIEKAKADLKIFGETESDLDKQSEIEVELEDQENEIEDLENVILIKSKGLTDEQMQKLLDLIKEFKNQTLDIKTEASENKQEILKRLRAKGFNETKLEEKESKLEVNAEKIAAQQIDQAQKMFDLADKLIEKAQSEKNVTIKQETFDLHRKSETKLNESRKALTDKEYKESIEFARESKKLSVFAIANIRGNDKLVKEKLNNLEKMEKIKEERKDLAEKIREEQRNLREKIKEENENRLEKLKEEIKSESEKKP